MSRKISRTNSEWDFLNARLNEVRMSDHERLRAKARLAQAETIVDAAFELIGFGKRVLKALAARPARHPANPAG